MKSPSDSSASPIAEDLNGATVGRYVISSRLGAGAMGEVYLAQHTQLRHYVAIKRLAPKLRSDEHYHLRFLREGQRASALNHPHVARVYDVLEEKGELLLVMEYVEGTTLRQRLKEPMGLEEFLDTAIQCGEALAAAHQKGILHGDIKPENIMVTPEHQIKVLDFGVARLLPIFDENAETQSLQPDAGTIAGTPAYMAPEVLLLRQPDARADIFSLGVVFYEMLSGRHPFLAGSFTATTDRILHEAPPPLSRIAPDVPEVVSGIVTKALAKEPTERYASAVDLLRDLSLVQAGITPRGLRSQWWRGRRLKRLLVGLSMSVVLACAGYWVSHHWPHGPHPGAVKQAETVRSIVILPFRNIGPSPQYEYFGAGLADVLNSKLTNARFLEVRSPRASRLGDSNADPVATGQSLGVDTVLSGSYQIEGGTLSLSYTLIDVRRNVHIAGNALEGPLVHALDLEHRLAAEIVDSLRVPASPKERARFTAAPTQQNEAFQAYLRSNYEMEQFWKRPGADQLSRVKQYLNEALRLDPHFTLALVSLARLNWIAMYWGYEKGPEILERAEEEINLAIGLDPDFGDTYAARALIELQRGQLDQMRQDLRQAFRYSPNSPLAYYAAGFYYLVRGLPDRSVQAFRQARALDPDLVRRELALAYRTQGDLARAEQQYRENLQEHPDDLPTLIGLTDTLMTRGDLDGAADMARTLVRRAPDDPGVQVVVAVLRLREGKPFPINSWLQRYRDIYWSDGGYCAYVAGVYALAHQPAEALRWLHRASELTMRSYPFLSSSPLFEKLRQEPDFQSYLESVRREWEEEKRREEKDPLLP
jgi:serine/threonine-protein kinase